MVLALITGSSLPATAQAEALCADVKIETQQERTLKRQAFDATMRINNGLDTLSIEDISVTVHFTDADGAPVVATDNPNDTSAAFLSACPVSTVPRRDDA